MQPSPSTQRAEFTSQFSGCAEWLYSYLLSLLRNPADAEEVLQETARVCWEKFDQYEPGTEFRAWACRVAHFKALKHREHSRRRPTTFSDLFINSVDEEAVIMADRLDVRMSALAGCMEKLSTDDRNLLNLRYSSGDSVEQIAQRLSRSTHRIYRSLSRVHSALYSCIERVRREEAAP